MRAIPTSRAYWELRAEQVLNRVFAPEAPIDVDITGGDGDGSAPQPASALISPPGASTARTAAAPSATPRPRPTQAGSATRAPWWRSLQRQPTLLMAGLGLAMTLMTGTTLVGLALWQRGQQAIRQERNLLLVERLRALGPAQTATEGAAAAPTASTAATTATAGNGEPPPPPSEAWMEELATLPASSAPPANVLPVPMNGQVSSPAPAASGGGGGGGAASTGAGPAASGELPQLVGVVQVPGRPGSAIFQVGGSSTSAASGETIGSSGWRLRSASGDSAVIESNGVQRRLSISSGL